MFKTTYLYIAAILLGVPSLVLAQFRVDGTTSKQISYTVGEVKDLFLCKSLSGSTLTFHAPSGSLLDAYCYNLTNSQVVSATNAVVSNGRVVFSNLQDGYAYGVAINGENRRFAWITDYSLYVPTLYSIAPYEPASPDEQSCGDLKLIINGDLPNIFYVQPGQTSKLSVVRSFRVKYQTLEWKDRKMMPKEVVLEKQPYPEFITTELPYTKTQFEVEDEFDVALSMNNSFRSGEHTPKFPFLGMIAHHLVRGAGNELPETDTSSENKYDTYSTAIRCIPCNEEENFDTGGSGEPLVASAPVEIEFSAYSNYPVATRFSWEISRDPKFTSTELMRSDEFVDVNPKTLRYIFDNAGTYYVRVVAIDAESNCEAATQPFVVNVSESKLEAPNVFTPGTDGINDEFKVVYQSIVKFNGWIFNRWGVEVFRWSDPSKGWNGKSGGRYVKPGVYFYVIEAEGSDGRKFKLKGDINVFPENN